jgi:hypothetical protein
MRDADVASVHELAVATFEDLGRRHHLPIPPCPDPAFWPYLPSGAYL